MPILLKGDDVRGGTKANAHHMYSYGLYRCKWVKKLFSIFYFVKRAQSYNFIATTLFCSQKVTTPQ